MTTFHPDGTPGCDTRTAISLFDGIGGFPRAFTLNGIRTVAVVEKDLGAAGVTTGHFPDARHFPDVMEVTADELLAAGFCPVCGIISAGWPCQDLSLAGRRLGLGGARSGLFWEIVRLARDLRPRWLLLENVPGLLSAVCSCPGGGVCNGADGKRGYYGAPRARYECNDPHPVRGGACGVRGRGASRRGRCMELHGGAMGAVLGALAELGYGFAYRVLDAQHFGVPQRRRRVVIVGCLGDWAAPAAVLLEPESGAGHSAPGRAAGAGTPGGAAPGADAAGIARIAPTLQGGGKRGYRIDAEMAAGGGLVAAPYSIQGSAISAGECVEAGPTGPGFSGPGEPMFTLDTRSPHAVAVPGEVVNALTRNGITGLDDNTAQGGHLIELPAEPEVWQQRGSKLQGSNGGASVGTLRKGNGNVTGGVPFLAQTITAREGKGPNSDGDNVVTHALTAEGFDASEDGTGRGTPLATAFDWQTGGGPQTQPNVSTEHTSTLGTTKQDAVSAESVRRLTPVECERLQGFPDGWTSTSHGRPQSDSARYRQLGNSIAVPVFAWVAGRIVAYESGALDTLDT